MSLTMLQSVNSALLLCESLFLSGGGGLLFLGKKL